MMKHLVTHIRLFAVFTFSVLTFSVSAFAADGFIELDLEGLHALSRQEREQDPCYQLAAEAEYVETETRNMGFPHVWIPGTSTPWRWRISEFTSGMRCEVLISGDDAQHNSRKVGCRCRGRVHVE